MSVGIGTGSSIIAGPPRALFDSGMNVNLQDRDRYEVAPDGKRFLISVAEFGETSRIAIALNWAAALKK